MRVDVLASICQPKLHQAAWPNAHTAGPGRVVDSVHREETQKTRHIKHLAED